MKFKLHSLFFFNRAVFAQFVTITAAILVFLLGPPLSFADSKKELVQIRSIKADFTQEKHLKILAQPLISKGSFTFESPQSLRWEYISPIPSVLLMHGAQVEKYLFKDGNPVKDLGMGLSSMQVVLAEISNWLDGRFTENKMFKVSFPDQHTVLLQAKNQELAGLISKITLQLAEQKGLLESVTIFEGPDSYTSMHFTNSFLNQNIPASIFTTP